jgi:hypothetical protein
MASGGVRARRLWSCSEDPGSGRDSLSASRTLWGGFQRRESRILHPSSDISLRHRAARDPCVSLDHS